MKILYDFVDSSRNNSKINLYLGCLNCSSWDVEKCYFSVTSFVSTILFFSLSNYFDTHTGASPMVHPLPGLLFFCFVFCVLCFVFCVCLELMFSFSLGSHKRRVIALIDFDCFYCVCVSYFVSLPFDFLYFCFYFPLSLSVDNLFQQVEQRRLGISGDVPLVVQQWTGIIAVN